MSQLDLHLHTTYSDGSLTPEQTVTEAAARAVTLIAITDHDEVDGIAPALAAAASCGIEVVSGVEINTTVGKEEVHILGYGFPTDSAQLRDGLQRRRDARRVRLDAMLARLASLGYPLELETVLAIAGKGSVGRPHLGRALVAAGYVPDLATAFERLIGNRSPAYIPRSPFTPEEAIMLIHQSGGVTSLAHPGKLGDPIRFLRRLKEAGLDALEAYHSDHAPAATQRMLAWARQYGLAVTGGSDSHGPNGPHTVQIGAVPIPDEIGAQFRELLAEKSSG